MTAINKTMDRSDLLSAGARPVVHGINTLIRTMYARRVYMTSWYGCLPERRGPERRIAGIVGRLAEWLGRSRPWEPVGMDNRGPEYEPLPGAADDARIPWYLYWEIYWALANGPKIHSAMRLLDAGGTSSLCTCYLASLGCEVHSVDINAKLVSNGNRIANAMGWKAFSYAMDVRRLAFEDAYFDHAYSICVFEHLDYEVKQAALREIARCLKPGGILSVTFDYRNPAPFVTGFGPDTRRKNQLSTEADIRRCFLAAGCFELLGNQEFFDNGKSYLVHPQHKSAPYTFGAVFLRKRD